MSAALLQTELKDALAAPPPPALEIVAAPVPATPASRRAVEEILIAFGKLSVDAAQRIKERAARTSEEFAVAARKMKLASPGDIEIARAIGDGCLRDDRSAFALAAELVVLRRPSSAAAEQYRALRARLVTTQPAEKLKLFSIAPASAAVRAEVAAANLAIAFAQLGRRVLLIDADLRRPSLGRLLALPRVEGLSQHVSRAASFEEALRETVVEGLSLIADQGPAPRPQELLASAGFAAMLSRAKSEFDIVLVLTSPFGPAADGQFVWAGTKSALVVAQRDETRAEELKDLQSALRQIGAEILGAVILA